MNIKPIRKKKDYNAAMKRIYELISIAPKKDTPEYDELDILSTLVEPYEKEHYPIEPPDPIEAIKYIMEEKGLMNKDVVKYFGSKSRVSEVLNKKRPLSLNIIKSLHRGLGIPYEILMA
ncbi:MAG: transcriptional regulator [Bacteroidota bacterium]